MELNDEVVCVNNDYASALTINKIYIILDVMYDINENFILVKDDLNYETFFRDDRFISLLENRMNKIKQLY